MLKIDLAEIRAARQRIAPYIHQTPIVTSRLLDQISGASLFFKCENQQVTGAFKIRGALNSVLSLPKAQLAAGVATHSSGNHGAALARAAQLRGIPAFVVMPENAPEVKKSAVAAYGGTIHYCEPTLAARERALARIVGETSATFVPPYDHAAVICGQGTVALEIAEQVDDLDYLLTPVGGGGLLAGVAVAFAAMQPETAVIGAEPALADDAYRSFTSGLRVTQHQPKTIADGLLTTLGELNFPLIRAFVKQILLVSEAGIIRAMELIWTRAKLVVEPSAAVPFAAVLENPELFAGRRVAIVLSGGNVDLARLPW